MNATRNLSMSSPSIQVLNASCNEIWFLARYKKGPSVSWSPLFVSVLVVTATVVAAVARRLTTRRRLVVRRRLLIPPRVAVALARDCDLRHTTENGGSDTGASVITSSLRMKPRLFRPEMFNLHRLVAGEASPAAFATALTLRAALVRAVATLSTILELTPFLRLGRRSEREHAKQGCRCHNTETPNVHPHSSLLGWRSKVS